MKEEVEVKVEAIGEKERLVVTHLEKEYTVAELFSIFLLDNKDEEKRIGEELKERGKFTVDMKKFCEWGEQYGLDIWKIFETNPERFVNEIALAFVEESDTLNIFLETYIIPPDVWDEKQKNKQELNEYCYEVVRELIELGNFPEDIRVHIEECMYIENDGKLVEVEGVIQYISPVTHLPVKVKLICPECGGENFEDTNYFGEYKKRGVCVHCGKPVKFIKDSYLYKNVQLMKITETVQQFVFPASVTVILEGKFIDKPDPEFKKYILGKVVRVLGFVEQVGVLKRQAFIKPLKITVKDEIDIEITENDIKQIKEIANNGDPIKILVKNIAPNIIGRDLIKEAILLALVGGDEERDKKGAFSRGAIHILLVGEPSTGKSSIAEFVSRVFPKGVFLSSGAISDVGIGLVLDRDPDLKTWLIRGGALMQGNRGIVFIDEFQGLSNSHFETLKVAMSQQVLTLSKAGINVKVKINTPIVGIMNPEFGYFDNYRSYIEQINIPKKHKIAILQRFDLKFAIKDVIDKELDSKIVRAILGDYEKPPLELETFLKYILYAREIKPVVPEEIREEMDRYYLILREKSIGGEKLISPRIIDSLRRLTQAIAKLRLHEVATWEDYEEAKRLLVTSLKQFGFVPEEQKISIDKAEGRMLKKEVDRISAIMNMFEKLEKLFGGVVPKKDFINGLMEEFNMTEAEAEKTIRMLLDNGKIYERKPLIYAKV